MKNVNGDSTASREKTIVRTSVIGIIANVFLAAFKAVIGLMSSSIAIIMDAVNNISDAGSSGFYMDKEKKTMRFDIVVSFDAEDRRAVYGKVTEAVGKEYPGYELQVAMDTDFSED